MSQPGEGGMTAESPSGWTTDTLRADVLGRLNELDKRLHGRGKGLSDSWGYVVGAVGAVGAVIAIILSFN